MTALEEIEKLAPKLPTFVLQDIITRIGDWGLSQNQDPNDPYIQQQLRYAKRFAPTE